MNTKVCTALTLCLTASLFVNAVPILVVAGPAASLYLERCDQGCSTTCLE